MPCAYKCLYISSVQYSLEGMTELKALCRFMRYLPKMVKHAKEVFLTYIAPVHYNTIR